LERGVRPMVTQKIKGKNSSAQHQAENWCRVCSLAFVRAVKYFPMRKKSWQHCTMVCVRLDRKNMPCRPYRFKIAWPQNTNKQIISVENQQTNDSAAVQPWLSLRPYS
jgi:hypothetical protein